MRLLAFDIGGKRTGVAYADTDSGIIVAKDTITHHSIDELIAAVTALLSQNAVDTLVIGLPLLPDGSKGEQAFFTESVAERLQHACQIPLQYIDERYSSFPDPLCKDPDAMAACKIADIALNLLKKSN